MDYKKILEGVVDIINTTEKSDIGFANICSYIGENCPELKESKDEKIKKAIISCCIDHGSKYKYLGVSMEEMCAWIEKQGEQKPVDKVEPKFHEGEWLCENEPNNYARFIQILEIVNVQGKERYRISRDIHNDEDIVEFDFVEKYYHKFDIKDAKDGDVLQLGEVTAIFKEFIGNNNCKCYCSVCNGEFETPSQEGADNSYGCYNTTPATEEQRDLLFQKRKEAGYEWDTDKKELKKIVSYCQEHCKGYQETGKCFFDEECQAKKAAEKKELKKIKDKPLVIDEGKSEMDYCFSKMMNGEKVSSAWSEEDEKTLNRIRAIVRNDDSSRVEDILWLKSLKDRMKGE